MQIRPCRAASGGTGGGFGLHAALEGLEDRHGVPADTGGTQGCTSGGCGDLRAPFSALRKISSVECKISASACPIERSQALPTFSCEAPCHALRYTGLPPARCALHSCLCRAPAAWQSAACSGGAVQQRGRQQRVGGAAIGHNVQGVRLQACPAAEGHASRRPAEHASRCGAAPAGGGRAMLSSCRYHRGMCSRCALFLVFLPPLYHGHLRLALPQACRPTWGACRRAPTSSWTPLATRTSGGSSTCRSGTASCPPPACWCATCWPH